MPATTGKLDSTTLSQVMSPKCGVPDNDYQKLHTTEHYSFYEGRPAWNHSTPLMLNYALSPNHIIGYIKVSDIRFALEQAFSRWSSVIPVYFMETQDYDHANITIGFYYYGDHGDGSPFDNTVLAYATGPGTGTKIHFNAARSWAVDFSSESLLDKIIYFFSKKGPTDLESVAIHEIGHVLGLGHSSIPEAVMHLGTPPRTKKVDLTLDDINGTAQALYGSNPNFNLDSLKAKSPASKSFGLREILTISISLVVKAFFLFCL